MRIVNFLTAIVAVFATSLLGAASLRAQPWPQRAVRVIVPLPPGNTLDVSARALSEQLSARWKQPVIVENMAGADGILATKEFIGRRDDHTLLYSFAGLITINPLLYEKLPYDPGKDLVPVTAVADNFIALAGSGKLNIGSVAELVALARARPGELNWAATPGLPYFAFAGLLKSAGVEMTYVPYRDFGPALADVGEGRIAVVATGLTQLLAQSEGGKARLLAVINPERAPIAPDVPTLAQAGFADFTFEAVTGFFGSRNLPDVARETVTKDVASVLESPAIKKRLETIGVSGHAGSAADFAAAIESQRKKVADIAAAIGTKAAQ